jgi:hypothetical protein
MSLPKGQRPGYRIDPPLECPLHDRLFDLAHRIDYLPIEIEMRLHQLVRSERHPLGERQILKVGRPEQLEEAQCFFGRRVSPKAPAGTRCRRRGEICRTR